jgi:hypothetical protein
MLLVFVINLPKLVSCSVRRCCCHCSNAELPEWLAREDDLPEQQEFSQYSEDGVTEYLIQNVLIGNILLGIWYRVGIRMQQ